MRDIRKLGTSAFYGLVACLVVGILVENVILMRQNHKLKSPDLAEQVRAGQRLQNLSAVSLDGRIQPIVLPTTASERLVIFTFSPTCPFCQRTQPIWAELSKGLRQRGIDVLWVSRDPAPMTKGYCEQTQIPLSSVLADPPNRSYVQLGLQAVPNTIVIGSGGVVEKVWSGALDGGASRAVFSYFGISQGSVVSNGRASGKEFTSSKCCKVQVQAQKN